MTRKESYDQMEQVRERLIELLHYQKNRLAYRKRTEIAVDIVKQIEVENNFPEANYAFDNGVLTLALTKVIERSGKHWVSEIEKNRNINWQGSWTRVDVVAEKLKITSPSSFHHFQVKGRNGEIKSFGGFTKVVRLKKYGKKRLVIAHETEDLSDTPRFLLTDALHWEINGQKSERFKFAKEKPTIGQRVYSLHLQALANLLSLAEGLFSQGQSSQNILELLMPA